MLHCDDPRLTALALGELDADERAGVEAELAALPEAERAACERVVAEIRQAGALLSQAFQAEACPTPVSALQAALAAECVVAPPEASLAVASAAAPVEKSIAHSSRGLAVALALSACLLACLTAAALWLNRDSTMLADGSAGQLPSPDYLKAPEDLELERLHKELEETTKATTWDAVSGEGNVAEFETNLNLKVGGNNLADADELSIDGVDEDVTLEQEGQKGTTANLSQPKSRLERFEKGNYAASSGDNWYSTDEDGWQLGLQLSTPAHGSARRVRRSELEKSYGRQGDEGLLGDQSESGEVYPVADLVLPIDGQRSGEGKPVREPVGGDFGSGPMQGGGRVPPRDFRGAGQRLGESPQAASNTSEVAPAKGGKGEVASSPRFPGENVTEHAYQVGQGSGSAGYSAGTRSGKPRATPEKKPGDKQDVTRAINPAIDEVKLHNIGPKDQDVKVKPQPVPRTWRRVKAIPNTSRLMVGDKDELALRGMQANVMVDGFRARVLLDCYYYNDRGRPLEGSFKIRLPDEASLYYFAFGETTFEYRPMVDQIASAGFLSPELVRASGTAPREIFKARSQTWGNVKEARLVPREKAAHAYSETVRRRVDPALVEWSGAGVFNARVFPLAAGKLHRIVIGYDVNLQQEGADLVYKFELPEELPESMIDLDIAALPGSTAEVTPTVRPFTTGGRAYYHFQNPSDRFVGVRFPKAENFVLVGTDGDSAAGNGAAKPGAADQPAGERAAGSYFATRVTPKFAADDSAPLAGSSHAIFLVDTSLSSNPDKFNVWLKLLAESLVRNRSSMKEFAVLFFGVDAHWWKPGYTENTPENVAALLKDCENLTLEGATDLAAALTEATNPAWLTKDEAAKRQRPDLFLLSDGAATWGELNTHLMAKTLRSGTQGTLFAYKTGLTGTAIGTLESLAQKSGGTVFSIAGEDELTRAAMAHRQRPWQLLEAKIDGGRDLLIAGRPSSLYAGQQLLIVGRGLLDREATLKLKLKRGEQVETLDVPLGDRVASELAARAYGQVAVGQLEDLMSATEEYSTAYARHFRVTGETCSLLMLDTEEDYARFDIKPEEDDLVVHTSAAAEVIATKLDELAQRLEDPKQAVLAWLARLEKAPGAQFELPTALRLAIEKLPSKHFDVPVQPLATSSPLTANRRADLPQAYLQELNKESLDYDTISAEADRRRAGNLADALKVLSNFVERNPGDPVLTRDVAFSALELGFPGQAYPLLKRVALLRPYEPQVYQALAQCLDELGYRELALVYYEVALHGKWNGRYHDFQQIASYEYLHLLRKLARSQPTTEPREGVNEYAAHRLRSLQNSLPHHQANLLVTMMWNTDRTDVDLHVIEPSGQECFFQNRQLPSGGHMTRDVTEGYGPEMYILPKTSSGQYKVLANYFASDANRTQARTKVYLKVYEDLGTPDERITQRAITLNRDSEKRELIVVKRK